MSQGAQSSGHRGRSATTRSRATGVPRRAPRWSAARFRAAELLARGEELAADATPAAHVILTAGHRNATNGGAPGEMARTPTFAHAYRDALRAAGCTVFYVQELDDDGDPDTFAGGLTAVANRVRTIADALPGNRIIMLDLHLEEGEAPPGVFTIVPDDPTGKSADIWMNNAGAVTLGHLITEQIAAHAGFAQRNAKELGVMSERETGVGEKKKRLAMFGGTAAVGDRMTRLIVEHGNIVKDKPIIDAPQTPALCAHAVVNAVGTFLGIPLSPPGIA